MIKTYIAITIGPIYKTFQNVRKTRELWAASFCFSFLMRNINEQLRGENGVKSEDFILPYFNEEKAKELFKLKGFGFFPDRLIFKSKEGDLTLLLSAIDRAFDSLTNIVATVIKVEQKDVLQYLKGYFQISYIEKTLTENDPANVILALSPFLDTLEQQNKYRLIEPETNYLYKFFTEVNNRKNKEKTSFLDEYYELPINSKKKRVESLIEITTRELKTKTKYTKHVNLLWDDMENIDKDEENQGNVKKATDTAFLEALIEECRTKYPDPKTNPFRSYHKYYCIIQGDGDKMGKALRKLNENSEVQTFSNHLTNWALETYKAVKEYQGLPIYVGGDDLLCIVPVCNGPENVFDLIERISVIFNKEFPDTYPSLSFGLSITYYKYPLAEAFVKAYELLKKAKKEGGNRIAAQIIKHSGNEMISVFDKTSGLYKQTLSGFLNVLNDREASSSSITYKLRDNEKVFELIGLHPERVTYFINHLTDSKAQIDTKFDELDKNEKFMQLVKQTVYQAYRQKANEIINQNMDKISEAAMKEIYSMLRIVKFVKGLDDDKS